MAYLPVLMANWLVFLLIDIITIGIFTDIVDGGVCLLYANSLAVQQAMGYYVFFGLYLLPLALMTFCYSRIVYTLRTKVIGLYRKLGCRGDTSAARFWIGHNETHISPRGTARTP